MGTETNTNPEVNATPSAPEKTFTQADVDRIVTNRRKHTMAFSGVATNRTNIELPPELSAEKTFTQADVDRIVTNRVAKYSDYEELKAKAAKFDEAEEANKSELQKAIDRANTLQAKLDGLEKENTVRQVREEVSQSTGVPASLLTAETKEDCEAQAKAIAAYKAQNAPTYPAVKDGGDPHINVKKATRDQFADWLNAQD